MTILTVTSDQPDGVLWTYRADGLPDITIAPPAMEIDGSLVACAAPELRELSERRQQLANGAVESVWEGEVADHPGLLLRLVTRVVDGDNPVVRFRYHVRSTVERHLTRSLGRDRLQYLTVGSPTRTCTEVRLSDYAHLVHSYVPTEVDVAPSGFDGGAVLMGPIVTWPLAGGHALIAYEHGSPYPDRYVGVALSPEGGMTMQAEKGNYLGGHDLREGFTTVWFHVAAAAGDRSVLQRGFRTFLLRHQAEVPASREPFVFYNTWHNQERVHHWTRRPYLADMNEQRMLAEIDVAHRMGIDVFVIDTGWYDRTGDWRVDTQRFPNGMAPIRERLDAHGMKLGLWFGPTSAALSSGMLARNLHNRMSWKGKVHEPRPIWETEESAEVCLVSSYADDFADELIRIARELGVTYFKWDAIQQYGCDAAGHDHGDESHTPSERADAYAFLQPLYMARVVRRLAAACPEAIVDFDITEGGRCVGLAFLEVGKYFLINNGPYLQNFDVPRDRDVSWSNTNLFFYPGQARGWVVRTPLSYDAWVPTVLFLSHYLPDEPSGYQDATVASLVLGQNGIWGDLVGAVSDDGADRIGRLLGYYKQVRDAVSEATLRRIGVPGGQVEIDEKVADDGRGVVSVFAAGVAHPFGPDDPLVVTHITAGTAARDAHGRAVYSGTENTTVELDGAGRAVITATFTEPGAAVVFLGAEQGRGGGA